MITKYLNYMHSSLAMTIDKSDYYLLKNIINFFSSYFIISQTPVNEPMANLVFYKLAEYNTGTILKEGTFVAQKIMRTSTAKEFNLDCQHYRLGNKDHYLCERTGTQFIFDIPNKTIQIYLSEKSTIQVIELIRDLIIKNEENNDALILHASAVLINNISCVVIGGKGAGKSTLLMEFLNNTISPACLIAGDKLFLTIKNDRLMIRGWPDYPHLGVGTIARFPRLCDLVKDHFKIELTDLPQQHKILIDPFLLAGKLGYTFANNFYPLDCCIFPQFILSQGCTVLKHDHPMIDKVIENLIFSGDYHQTKWHKLIVPHYRKKAENIDRLTHYLKSVRIISLKGDLKLNNKVLKEIIAC